MDAARTPSGGSSTAVISSSGLQLGLDLRRVAGQAMEVGERDRALPCGPETSTAASSAASATHMSDGWVAMQAREAPRIACIAVEAVDRVAARAAAARLLQRAASS